MNLEPAPRLPKWIFLAIDAGLLLVAFVIVYFAKDPYAPLPFVSAVLCVVLAILIVLVPFLTDYDARLADAIERERQRGSEQITRLHAATESLVRAAAQIKSVEEAVHKASREAETLPYRMQEKLAEFNDTLASKEDDDRAALETELEELRSTNSAQLKATAERIAKATLDWAALEVATRKQFSTAEATLAQMHASAQDAAAQFEQKISAALQTLEAKLAPFGQVQPAANLQTTSARAPVEKPEPAAAQPAPEIAAHEPPVADEESVAPAGEPIPVAAESSEPPKPKKPRAPRKPKSEEAPAVPADEAIPAAAEEVGDSNGDSEPAPAPESSTSSDGATRLLATAYIGIGNKLFIRGDGPGLGWDKGVPMQFVSIGKWGWSSQDATGPVRCKLYKNDEVADLTGEIVLEPGRHTDLTALF
ncbi:MAG: hypothetical protein Q8J74_14105 [Candidatus Didemnitutus sp.]|nr:hypothetical protein [Candidatus Didemnitutus sp.]